MAYQDLSDYSSGYDPDEHLGTHHKEGVLSALATLDYPSSFCVGVSESLYAPPGLRVRDLGLIGLPLTGHQAQDLAKLNSEATSAGGLTTVPVANMRKCLRLSPDEFTLSNPYWDGQVQEIANGKVRRGFGIPETIKIMPQLCKLLLIEAGGFYKSHQEAEKVDGLFGMLTIFLPSTFSGGEVEFRHADYKTTYDFGQASVHQLHYAAALTSCQHEIMPVKTGYQLALMYSLFVEDSAHISSPADNSLAVDQILQSIESWSHDERAPEKLVMLLENKYYSARTSTLSLNNLKGRDIMTVDVLSQAAKLGSGHSKFRYCLGMLVKKQDGDTRFQEYDLDTVEVESIISTSGGWTEFAKLEIKRKELMPKDALKNVDWDEEEYEDDHCYPDRFVTREYRHAVLVMWPYTQHWKLSCTNHLENAVKDAYALANLAELTEDQAWELQCALSALCARGAKLRKAGLAPTVAQLVVDHGNMELAKLLLGNGSPAASIMSVDVLRQRFRCKTRRNGTFFISGENAIPPA